MKKKNEYSLERLEQYIHAGSLNVKDMATIESVPEEVKVLESVTKKTQTTPMKIAQMKLNTQTAKKLPLLSNDLITSIKEREKCLR